NRSHHFMLTNAQFIEKLNRILEQEHSCAIRYYTHAALVKGPYAETVAARLRVIGDDEIRHAEILRERIVALGGEPSMMISVEAILKINIDEEKQAIDHYLDLFKSISPNNAILYQAIQDLIRDEQEHLEELENLC